MRACSVLAAAAILLSLAAPLHAETWIETGTVGFNACMDNFLDRSSAKAALKGDGWRYEGNVGFGNAYSKEGRRLIVIHGEIRPHKQACAVMVRKMSPEQAVALAQAFMARANSIKPAKLTEADSVAEWTGTFNGHPVRFAALREGNIGINHGSAVIMTEE